MAKKKIIKKVSTAKEKPSIENRGMGSIPNPLDVRDISLASVQAPVALPKKYKTDISKLRRRDQKDKESCVGHAGAELVDLFELFEANTDPEAVAQGLYALCKARDGYAGGGTYPRVLAKVLTEIGCPTKKTAKDDPSIPEPEYSKIEETKEVLADAYPFRVDTNYAWVNADAESLKQAIYQNKAILASLEVGKDYSDGRMTAQNPRGRHYILIFGFEEKTGGDVKFNFLNSWGKDWGDNGEGYFNFSDMQGHIFDVLAFVDIPNALLEQAKVAYKFTLTLRRGSVGNEVMELQKRLATEIATDGKPCFRDGAFDLEFGRLTEAAVQRYQIVKNIVKSGTPETTGFGQLGAMTRNALNNSISTRPTLYPRVQEMRDKLIGIMAAIGKPITVTGDYRTFEEQEALYAQGRTKPGNIVTNAKGGESLHNYRCAFDVAYKNGSGITYEGDFFLIGTIGKILGLEWGGDWTDPVDKPHFQFTAGYSIADFQNGKIDESKFGVVPPKALELEDNTNNYMSILHRIKSGIITAVSFIGTAIVTVAISNPGAVSDGLDVVQAKIASFGLPAAYTVLAGLVINEIARALINKYKIKKAQKEGISTARASGLRLY